MFRTQLFTIQRIPRSSEVCQSWSSSVVNTLLYSIPLVFRPDMSTSKASAELTACSSLGRSSTLSDFFFIQWSTLKDKYPKSIYLGRI
ncbi:unnamed protein product, partial [Coregonus sp. 'balchen']